MSRSTSFIKKRYQSRFKWCQLLCRIKKFGSYFVWFE